MNTRCLVAAMVIVIVAGFSFAQETTSESLSPSNNRDALQLYRSGAYSEAIEVTLSEIVAAPRNLDAYTVLGWSLVASGRYKEAIEYAERALQISGFDSRIIEIAAEAHFYLDNLSEALHLFERYVVIAPNGSILSQVYYFMGEIFLRFDEYHHADIALSTAVYHNNDEPLWWTRLGFARERNREWDRAYVAYDRALALNPAHTEALRGIERLNASGER